MKTMYKETKKFTEERLAKAIEKSFDFAQEKQFKIKGQPNASFEKLALDYEEAIILKIRDITSFSLKKKINKSLRRLEYKMTRKNINLFFHYLNTRLELKMSVKFEMPTAEQEVVTARENYKLLKQQLEEAKIKYKDLKKTYYGKGEMSTEYIEK